MPLPADLARLTARELKTALIIARRHGARGDLGRILAEYNRRGIRPTGPKTGVDR